MSSTSKMERIAAALERIDMKKHFRPSPFRTVKKFVVAGKVDYDLYMHSEAWDRKRAMAIRRAGNRCQICNSSHNLSVHHRTYIRLGKEALADLTVLCQKCHDIFHEHGHIA